MQIIRHINQRIINRIQTLVKIFNYWGGAYDMLTKTQKGS